MVLYKHMNEYEKARFFHRKELVHRSHLLIEKLWPQTTSSAYKYIGRKLGRKGQRNCHFTFMDFNEVIEAYNLLRAKAIERGIIKPKKGPHL